MVLNGASGPSPATREAGSSAAAAQRGYRGDRTAALLARRRTRTLGVTLIPGNLYHGELAEEIRAAAEAAGYEVVLKPARPAARATRAARRRDARGLPVRGAVLLGPDAAGRPARGRGRRRAHLVVGRPSTCRMSMSSVPTTPRGSPGAVDHLAGLGHRRIAHVDGGAGAVAEVRREAFVAATRGRRLEPLLLPGGLTEEEGAAALDALGADAGVTALVAFNDRTAVGVLDRLERSGVRVPAVMSLTGFDDSPLARHVRIDLTSVAQGYLEQARVAVRLVLERLEGGRSERCEIVVPTRLVVRGSTAAPGS